MSEIQKVSRMCGAQPGRRGEASVGGRLTPPRGRMSRRGTNALVMGFAMGYSLPWLRPVAGQNFFGSARTAGRSFEAGLRNDAYPRI